MGEKLAIYNSVCTCTGYICTPTSFARAGESEKYPMQRQHALVYIHAHAHVNASSFVQAYMDTLLDLPRLRVEVSASTSCLIWSLTSPRGSFLDQSDVFKFS